jgi:hypothetical protein
MIYKPENRCKEQPVLPTLYTLSTKLPQAINLPNDPKITPTWYVELGN